MPDQFEKYYTYLKSNGADVAPDFNSFKNTLSNYDNASKYYTYLKDNKFDVPETYDSFADTFGLKKKVSGEISSLTELPSEFIEPLKKGVSPNQTKEEERLVKQLGIKPMTGVAVPTNLPKQDEMRYERELKTQDAAINTLTDIYKQKGLKFDPSKPAAQEQIQDYIEQERSNDLARVTGKDGKEYLTRGQGFIEAGAKALVNSVIEPFKSAEINFTNTPSELADLLDKKIAEEPNVPESAPTKVGGYMGGLLGGLPKLMGLLAIPYFGESAMVIEMYHNAIANERRTLYQRGIMSKENGGEGLDREAAAKMAMETAPITAAPDAAMGLVLARGVSGKNIIPDAEKKAFRDALAPFKDVAKVAGLGGVAGSSKSLLALASGYDVTATEVLESGGRSAGEYALMDGAFKLMHKAGTIANVGLRASKAVVSAAKNLLSSVPKEVLEVQAEKYPDGKEIIQKVEEFAKVKDEVKDLVPAEKVGAVAGITQKIKNIQVDIDELTARREKTTDALKPQIDEWLKEYQDEIDFYNNQIKKVVKSKDPSGISEEIDDVTGEKIGAKKYIVDSKEVSQGEFEAMQGKPEGTKEIITAEVKVTEAKRIVEPSKPISEMNSEELGDFATETRKALKKQDKDFEGKTEKEKEDGGYYDVIDEVEDLRDASERINFIENAEDVNDLANSVKSTLSNIKGKEPNEYQLAILNAAKNKAIELGIDSKDLIKNITSKIANQYEDVEDAELMVKSALEKLIPSQEVKPTEVKEEVALEEEPTQSDIAKQQTIETDLLIGGQAAQRRKDNKYTKDGVEYVRNSKGNGVPSSVTGDVRFTNEVSLPFKYKLIEAKDLQPSHQDGMRNPNHFIPEAQPKNRNDAGSLMAENSFSSKPRFEELGENTNAYSGAPIVNERGEVVQGNNRAAGLRKGYDAKNKQYKNDLANNSSQFGFTKEQVEKMNEPILVREVAVSDEGAIEVGNYDVKDLETGGKRRLDPIAITRRMPFDIKGRIAEMLFTGEETLNQAIRANQKRVLELLNPYLNQAQRNTITKEGVLTDAGIKDLEDVVKQFLFDNGDTALPDLFENLSANQKEGLKKSLPYIFSTSPDKSIVPDIQEAILAVADFRDSGAGDFNAWLAQGDMFADGKTPRDKYTPLEIEIAKTLIEAKTQKEIVKKFGDYSDIVKDKEANMFDPAIAGKTRAEGIKEIFKTEDYAKPISERGGKTPVRKEELAAEPSPKPRNAKKEKIAREKAPEKSVEEAYKDLTINQKRQINNSKFDKLLKELKIEKICPT